MNRRFFLQSAAAMLALSSPAAAQEAADLLWLYDDILRDRLPLSDGNPAGDVAVVEFFDYRCPYCRAAHPVLKRLVAEDPGLFLIYKEWPAPGTVSELASRLAIAARWQDRYAAAHDALMRLPGAFEEPRIRDALAKAGIDLAALERDREEQKVPIERILRQTASQARGLRLEATPAFIIGGALHVGGLDEAGLRAMIAAARRKR